MVRYVICSYEELVIALSIGEEFDFYIGNGRYGISKGNNNKWCLAKYGDENFQVFKSYTELLENGRIDGKSIKSVWKYARV